MGYIEVGNVVGPATTYWQQMVNRQPHGMKAIEADVNLALANVAASPPNSNELIPGDADLAGRPPLVILLGIGPATPNSAATVAVASTAGIAGRDEIAAIQTRGEMH
jgi:hypothetical protein